MSPFRNADVRNDFSARYGVFKGIMMLEGEPEMVGHGIQLMGSQRSQDFPARSKAAHVGELYGGQAIERQRRTQVTEIEHGVVDDHAVALQDP
jgi:hypothetical protein